MLKSESTKGLHQCLLYGWLCQCDIGTQLNCAGEQIAQVQPVMAGKKPEAYFRGDSIENLKNLK